MAPAWTARLLGLFSPPRKTEVLLKAPDARSRLAASPELLRLMSPGPLRRRPLLPEEAAEAAVFLSTQGPAPAARALRALGPANAASVFRRLIPVMRAALACELMRPSSDAEPPSPRSIERLLLAFLARAKESAFFEEMLLRLPEAEREEAAAWAAGAFPERASRLKGLPVMADLARAGPRDLQTCLCKFTLPELSAALCGLEAKTASALLQALPEPLSREVREAADGLRLSFEATAAARGEILSRWRRLSAEGRVGSPRQ